MYSLCEARHQKTTKMSSMQYHIHYTFKTCSYAYVVKGGDLFSQRLPVVVLGLDIAVLQGDRAVIFSLLAGKDAFAAAERDFRRFVATAELR